MTIYLDHAATTPINELALTALNEQIKKLGNASSVHNQGRAIRKDVEDARHNLAEIIGCKPNEIIFTASGTEANNLAIKGFYWQSGKKVIITSKFEHHAVLDPVEWLATHQGAEIIYVPVTREGFIDLDFLKDVVSKRKSEIAVISIMHSNNELGAIQPIAEVVKIAGDIPVHTDAVQSFGKIEFNFHDLGISAATISAHKLGGPLGVAALILKRGLDITPLLHGGGQERDIRSSTVNAPGIVSFATAVDQALAHMADNYSKMSSLQFQLREDILREVQDARINGLAQEILPNILNVTFPGTKNESLLVLLDMAGISASQGSACSAGVQRPSHVLLAMGLTEEEADSTVRFSLGHTSTQEDIDVLCGVIADVVKRAIK